MAAQSDGPAEATLNLEPLRLPITTMVAGTLRAERQVLEQMGTGPVRTEAGTSCQRLASTRRHMQRADCPVSASSQEWQAATAQTTVLHSVPLEPCRGGAGGDQGQGPGERTHFWRRAMLAAWLVALYRLGPGAGGLCGMVWLALYATHNRASTQAYAQPEE